jgi:hypothetical protein
VVAKTKVTAWYQLLYVIAYSAVIAGAVGVFGGGVGFLSSTVFVHQIFSDLKMD